MTAAPAFWWRKGATLPALLLAGPAALYGFIAGHKMLQKPRGRSKLPVLCIGNFVVGGAGKTPFALRLAARLKSEGYKPGFLLRGYGGQEKGPLAVNADNHDAAAVGDEALLLAASAPTVVSSDRVSGADELSKLEVDLILMDDGFQNPALHKDLSIVLVDAETGIGNGFCLPAGPLRAPMARQIVKTDMLVVVGDGDAADDVVHLASRRGAPIFNARLAAEKQGLLRQRRLLAYAGIGRPEKFFRTLENEGLTVAKKRAFADHHAFSEGEAKALLVAAEQDDLQLVTTAKDMVRLKGARSEIFRWLEAQSVVLQVEMQIDDEDHLIGLIQEKLRQRTFEAKG